MKKIIFVLALAMVLAGGAVGITPASSQAQFYQYPPPPMNIIFHAGIQPSAAGATLQLPQTRTNDNPKITIITPYSKPMDGIRSPVI